MCSSDLKAGRIGLKLTRDARDGADWLHFAVSDTGIGMTPEQMKRLFQAFSQADASTTRKYGGTGLGLTISERPVGLMGGAFEITSDHGAGSCFSFTARLPGVGAARASHAAEEYATPPAHAGSPTASRLDGVRILVAEDNAFNQQVAQELLESAEIGRAHV